MNLGFAGGTAVEVFTAADCYVYASGAMSDSEVALTASLKDELAFTAALSATLLLEAPLSATLPVSARLC